VDELKREADRYPGQRGTVLPRSTERGRIEAPREACSCSGAMPSYHVQRNVDELKHADQLRIDPQSIGGYHVQRNVDELKPGGHRRVDYPLDQLPRSTERGRIEATPPRRRSSKSARYHVQRNVDELKRRGARRMNEDELSYHVQRNVDELKLEGPPPAAQVLKVLPRSTERGRIEA